MPCSLVDIYKHPEICSVYLQGIRRRKRQILPENQGLHSRAEYSANNDHFPQHHLWLVAQHIVFSVRQEINLYALLTRTS
jgi:hypothetical protein